MAKRRNTYCWRSRTDDGRKRELRAFREGGGWQIESLEPDAEDWARAPKPLLEDLVALEELLFNKYQRKHTSWELLDEVRQMVAARRARLPKPDTLGSD